MYMYMYMYTSSNVNKSLYSPLRIVRDTCRSVRAFFLAITSFALEVIFSNKPNYNFMLKIKFSIETKNSLSTKSIKIISAQK